VRRGTKGAFYDRVVGTVGLHCDGVVSLECGDEGGVQLSGSPISAMR